MTQAKAGRLIRKAAEYLEMLMQYPDLAYAAAQAALEKWRDTLSAIPGVLSVDVGMKCQNDQFTRIYAIRVHVKKKRRLGSLSPSQQIPPFCDNIPTDVMEGYFQPVSAGGDRIFEPGNRRGTLGIGVLLRADGRERYLTCTHVVSRTNTISVPTAIRDESGNAIGIAHPNASPDVKDNWEHSAFVDCALITPPNPGFNRVGIPGAPKQPVDLDPHRMRLPLPADESKPSEAWKFGAETGLTIGRIVSIRANVPIDDGNGGVIPAQDQIEAAFPSGAPGFAEDGDSGSILCVGKDALGIIRAVNGARVLACPFRHPGGQGAADILKFTI